MSISIVRYTSILAALSAVALTSCSGGGAPSMAPLTPSTHMLKPLSSSVRSLKCFTQDGGTCSIAKDGTVTLGLPDPPAPDAGAGVYFASDNSLKGLTLTNLQDISFFINGPYQAGSPRVSIPVTYNGTPTTAFIYPQGCGFSSTSVDWTVDPVAAPNNTGNYCMEMNGFNSPQEYWGTWSAFTAQFGGAVISSPPFFLVDADNATGGTWIVSSVQTTP